ncbi:hypothetical protein [Micromonospora sp. NPDC050695]|uniref:hypothetical protein n=1 Tax=Micromonospora sp. NPDC050695 TaxID=3154938 RepID=UPI0033DDD2ED
MNADALDRRLRRIMAKVETGKPTTAEDVQLAAVVWAVGDQPDEAAAGHTTGADLRLAAVVRANPAGGDAAAQTVCDAAHAWRADTRLDRVPAPGPSRRLLAATVDHHSRSWWQRNRFRVAGALGFVGAVAVGAEALMVIEGMGPPVAHGVLLLVAAACLGAFVVVTQVAVRAIGR